MSSIHQVSISSEEKAINVVTRHEIETEGCMKPPNEQKTQSFYSQKTSIKRKRDGLEMPETEDRADCQKFEEEKKNNEPVNDQKEDDETDDTAYNYEEDDDFEERTIKNTLANLWHESYNGKVKESYQKFLLQEEGLRKRFASKKYSERGEFELSINAATVCLYAQMNVKAEVWLNHGKKFESCIEVLKHEKENLIRLYNMLGDLATRKSSLPPAQQYLAESKKMIESDYHEKIKQIGTQTNESKEINNKLMRAGSWHNHNLAEVYLLKADLDKEEEKRDQNLKMAEKLMLEALNVREKLKRARFLAYSHEALTRLYLKTNLEKAKEFSKKAKLSLKSFEDECFEKRRKENPNPQPSEYKFFLSGARECNCGNISNRNGDQDRAKEHYSKGLELLFITLPKNNGLSQKYEKEYEDLFGEPYQYKSGDESMFLDLSSISNNPGDGWANILLSDF